MCFLEAVIMAQSLLQGVKCNISYCVVCVGQKELRLIHSKAGEHKNFARCCLNMEKWTLLKELFAEHVKKDCFAWKVSL